MFIIPVERKLDWRRPAWVTLGLILLNLLVFIVYQGGDQERFQATLARYLAENLDQLEAPVYENYLQRQINLHKINRIEDLDILREVRAQGERADVGVMILGDADFAAYARANAGLYWQGEALRHWQAARQTLDLELTRLSYREAGLVPGDLQLSDLVTYAFLHGGWAHLLGNLVFLLILGFTVEQALGPVRYLLAYLLCAALSGAGYALMEDHSLQPMIGASGAVSGLMGMYVAIYGLRSIQFFYFVGVFFDYFKAPALVMLPVWLLKEFYDYWSAGATGIAYMAHFFGLLAGAILVGLFGRSWLQVQDSFFAPEAEAQEAEYRKEWAAALAEVGRLQFDRARVRFEQLRAEYPDNPGFLEQLYHLAKLQPGSSLCRERTVELMNDALRRGLHELARETYADYHKLAGEAACLDAEVHQRMLFASLREADLKEAERIFERLRHVEQGPLAQEACRLLINELDKRQKSSRARAYREWLDEVDAR